MPLIVDVYNVLHQTGILPPDMAGIGVEDLRRLVTISRYRNEVCRLVCDGPRPPGRAPAGERTVTAGSPEPTGGAGSTGFRLVYESDPPEGERRRKRTKTGSGLKRGGAHAVDPPSPQSHSESEGLQAFQADLDQLTAQRHRAGARPAGRGEATEVDDRFPRIEILWSGSGVEADAVIERLIAASHAPRSLTVVSSDRRVLRAARRRKCVGLTSDRFLVQLMTDFSGRLARTDRPVQAYEIPLDRESIRWWLRYLGLESGGPVPPVPEVEIGDDELTAHLIRSLDARSPSNKDNSADGVHGSRSDEPASSRRHSKATDASDPPALPVTAFSEAQHLVQHWFDEDPAARVRLASLLNQYRDAMANAEGGDSPRADTRPDRAPASTRDRSDRQASLSAEPRANVADGGRNIANNQQGSESAPRPRPGRADRSKSDAISEGNLTRWWLRYFDLDPDDLPDDLMSDERP